VKSTNNFYSSSGRSEIDLRSELNNTLYGNGPEIAKHVPGLLRQFRRDSQDNTIPCPCVNSVTKEPDRETRCPICLGEGALWDETDIEFYIGKSVAGDASVYQDRLKVPGIMNTELVIFYISSKYSLTKVDKLVSLSLDKEGKPFQPITRFQLFRIAELREMRLDNGRLEFWKAYGYQDNNKFI
jgi:hypothetical protein